MTNTLRLNQSYDGKAARGGKAGGADQLVIE